MYANGNSGCAPEGSKCAHPSCKPLTLQGSKGSRSPKAAGIPCLPLTDHKKSTGEDPGLQLSFHGKGSFGGWERCKVCGDR